MGKTTTLLVRTCQVQSARGIFSLPAQVSSSTCILVTALLWLRPRFAVGQRQQHCACFPSACAPSHASAECLLSTCRTCHHSPGSIVSSALFIWHILMLVTLSESPVCWEGCHVQDCTGHLTLKQVNFAILARYTFQLALNQSHFAVG